MKFTLSWLKDHLDTTATPERISETLTAIGLEVESVEDRASLLKDFIVAEIVEAAPHPNASKLQVCKVNDGQRLRQIVCGAANARSGLKVVLAREGVHIPGGNFTIKKSAIRGVESEGMLCSAEELGLAEQSEGIIELPPDATPGAAAASALGADDPVFDIAITPNRADALGVRGIARDLAAAGLGILKPLSIPTLPNGGPSPVQVSIETPDTCPLFIGYHIRGVKNGESPAWLKQRLAAIGQKSISALVDITNYFTFTFARPLHVFDATKLSDNLVVRSARPGETLTALNGKEYALAPGMTVIADNTGALALGGIMGGASTGVSEHTTDVFLEVALFDPINIAKTGRALDILSDARYRFERGVDAGFAADGAKLAVQMILDLCGGTTSAPTQAGTAPANTRTISFSPKKLESLGGVNIASEKAINILTTLGFSVSGSGNALTVTPPTYRQDVEGEADLVEEILRIHGYAAIPSTPLPVAHSQAQPTPTQKRKIDAKRLLAARGMLEVVSWSFLPSALAQQFGAAQPIVLQNPISTDLDAMRPSLLPNLLTAARDNGNRGAKTLALFEVGPQFAGVKPEEQRLAAAAIRTGATAEYIYEKGNFRKNEQEPDCFAAKADALALLAAMGVKAESLTITAAAPAWYHPGRSGTFALGKNVLGYFGEIHPRLTTQFDLEGRVSAFELLLDAIPLPKAKAKAKSALKLSDFQAVSRDFAFVVKRDLPAAQLLKAVRSADPLITDAQLFDVYAADSAAENKSMAISITLQAMDRTLSEADISGVAERVIAAAGALGGVLRQ